MARWRNGFRFSSFDSYMGNTSDPQSLHKYLYANANPINLIDPSGHFTFAQLGVATGMALPFFLQAAGTFSLALGQAVAVVSAIYFVHAEINLALMDPREGGEKRARFMEQRDTGLFGMLAGVTMWALGVEVVAAAAAMRGPACFVLGTAVVIADPTLDESVARSDLTAVIPVPEDAGSIKSMRLFSGIALLALGVGGLHIAHRRRRARRNQAVSAESEQENDMRDPRPSCVFWTQLPCGETTFRSE